MNSRYRKAFKIISIVLLFLIAGCQPAAAPAETAPITDTTETPEEGPVEQPAAVPDEPSGVYALSDQAYQAPDGVFSLRLPAGWNCSEPAPQQVDCQSPDGIAALTVSATNTGYEITDEALSAFAHAEMVRAYVDAKEYNETGSKEESGEISAEANWRIGDELFTGAEYFIRKGAAVVRVHSEAAQDADHNFQEIIPDLLESIAVDPVALRSIPLYNHRFSYTAPDLFFELEIPTAWVKFADAATVKNTVMEGFLSPDERASVQVAVYRRGSVITQTLKAEKTLEIMRAYYGFDLRVSHDKALPDGRERLAWSAERKGVSGISYFDAYGGSLYVFSVIWEEPTEDIYLPVLEQIQESFERN